MIESNNAEEIKKLIKKGFDLELISFELDVPIEELKELKKSLENNVTRSFSKMEQLRIRYNKLYYSNSDTSNNSRRELSKKENELVNSFSLEIENKINDMLNVFKVQREEKLKEILAILKKIEKFNISISQAEKLYTLMNLPPMEELMKLKEDKISIIIRNKRRRIIKKLADAVDDAQEKLQDIEELKKLEKILTSKTNSFDPIIFGVVNKIENKILKIKQNKIIGDIKNNVSKSIECIVNKIASGELDIKEANEIIQNEIEKKIKNSPESKFSLKEEQIRKQILMQITNTLIDKSEKYKLENPEYVIEILTKLHDGEIEQSIRTVIYNLINIKDYEKANEICEEYYKEYKHTEYGKYIIMLKKEVKNAEIADFVLKGIKSRGTEEQENEYFNLIQKGLKMGNVKLTAVCLGKNEDKTKNIYLSDIWKEKVNYKER